MEPLCSPYAALWSPMEPGAFGALMQPPGTLTELLWSLCGALWSLMEPVRSPYGSQGLLGGLSQGS